MTNLGGSPTFSSLSAAPGAYTPFSGGPCFAAALPSALTASTMVLSPCDAGRGGPASCPSAGFDFLSSQAKVTSDRTHSAATHEPRMDIARVLLHQPPSGGLPTPRRGRRRIGPDLRAGPCPGRGL